MTLRLIVFDVDEDTGSKSIKDIKEQDVYMGDMPLMTMNGTFIVNGTERVIVSQMHRSPGVFFAPMTRASRTRPASCSLPRASSPIAAPGSISSSTPRTSCFARIDRRRKIPVTSLLMALGMDGEEILSTFYNVVKFEKGKDGWRIPFSVERVRGQKAITDLIDADSGEVLVEAGKKVTARQARQMKERGVVALRATDEDLFGNYLAEDVVNFATGEIYLEAGDEIDEKTLKVLLDAGYEDVPVLDIDHVTVGAYIRNTLAADKNENRQDALFDIYRVMRPGEPPTMETAEAMFQSLFFDAERYDLSAVGRVKMNMRLDVNAEDTVRVLRKEDILAVGSPARGPARRQGRDRRHRQSRQSPRAFGRRAHGEPVPRRSASHGARDQGAHVVGRDRHRHAAGPDQREAGGRRRARVFFGRRRRSSSWIRPTRFPRSRTSVVSRRSAPVV